MTPEGKAREIADHIQWHCDTTLGETDLRVIATAIREAVAEKEAENKRLREAVSEIARPTYGTEFSDTDAERADHYWSLVSRFQQIARAALREET